MGGSVTKYYQYSVSSTFIHDSLLDEIFQHVDLLKLLALRRVCRQWHRLISREAALYHRQIAIRMYQISNESFQSQEQLGNNVWQYAKKAKTLLLFENPTKTVKLTSYQDGWYVTAILRLYTMQLRAGWLTHLIERVVFANTTIREDDFKIPAIYRSTVAVTIIQDCRIMLRMDSVFGSPIPQEPAAMHYWATRFMQGPFVMQMCNLVGFKAEGSEADPEATLRWLETPDLEDVFDHLPNFTVKFLFKRCDGRTTTDRRIVKVFKFRRLFVFRRQLNDFVGQLIAKFDPDRENEEAFNCFWAGDMRGFCTKAHPLVVHFLLQFRKVVQESHYISCSESRRKNRVAQASA